VSRRFDSHPGCARLSKRACGRRPSGPRGGKVKTHDADIAVYEVDHSSFDSVIAFVKEAVRNSPQPWCLMLSCRLPEWHLVRTGISSELSFKRSVYVVAVAGRESNGRFLEHNAFSSLVCPFSHSYSQILTIEYKVLHSWDQWQ
jgi:hypothetical protein